MTDRFGDSLFRPRNQSPVDRSPRGRLRAAAGQYRLALLLLGALFALFGGVMIVFPTLPLNEDLPTLLTVLGVIGGVAIIVGYSAYRLRLVRWLWSLRYAVLVAMLLTVMLIFLNIWVTAHLMFISEYDLEIVGILLVVAGAVALIFGFFISRAITDGIRELAVAAEQLANGDLDVRLDVQGNDELAQFALTFNWMVERLREVDAQKRALDQQRRDLIAWASHDLRTPVTAIRAMSEAILDEVVTDHETMMRYVRHMNQETRQLSRLIDALFELAQLDSGHLQIDKIPVSLRDLISDIVGAHAPRADAAGLDVTCDVAADLDPVNLAPDKIGRVLNNLLDNAIRYTPAGGQIHLHAHRNSVAGSAVIAVRNHALGMPLLDPTLVFTRFYRRDPARHQSEDGQRGAGLGLAIARGFVEAHGGQITVASDAGTGVTFTITLPLM